MSDTVRVTGRATPEEVAAVLAVVTARAATGERDDDPYRRWRRVRLAALRTAPR